MPYMLLQPIDEPLSDHLLLAWAEVFCFAGGEFKASDFPLDQENALSRIDDFLEVENASEYAEEPELAMGLLIDSLEAKVVDAAFLQSQKVGFEYPFEIQPDAGVILRRKSGSNSFTTGIYIAMQAEQLLQKNLLEIWNDSGSNVEDGSADFMKHFRRLLEVTSALAVANYRKGIPIVMGNSRSVRQSLIPTLEKVCKIIGVGAPKSYEMLNETQKAANDGGADAFVICRYENETVETALVGATNQQSSLRNKTVGTGEIARIKGYLIDSSVLGSVTGFFTHSDPANIRTKGYCEEIGCIYFHRGLLLAHLQAVVDGDRRKKFGVLHSMRAAREAFDHFASIKFEAEFDRFELPCESTVI